MESQAILQLEERTLKESLTIQGRVIWALILREIKTRFGKNQLGYIWAILEPCMHISVWFFLFLVIRKSTGSGGMTDPLLVLTTGIIPFFFFRRVYSFVGKGINANRALLHYPLVRHIDLLSARFILEGATMGFVGTFLIVILSLTGIVPVPADILGLLKASGILLFLSLGFGSFNSVACILSPTYEKFLTLIARILYFTSGIHYLAEQLPSEAVRLLSYNPVLHGVELFRQGFIYNYKSSFASFSYIAWWAAGLLLVALLLERVYREQLREP